MPTRIPDPNADVAGNLIVSLWKKYFLGRDGTWPIVVRFFRGGAEIAILGATAAITVWLSSLNWGELGFLAVPVFAALQLFEGGVDQTVDPSQNRAK